MITDINKHRDEFIELFSINNLVLAEKKARKGKGFRKDISNFHDNFANNIQSLHNKIINNQFIFGPYKEFTLYDSKKRLIISSPYDDRIIHWVLYDYLDALYDKKFIFDSYGNRKNKGTHKGAKRAFEFSRKEKNNYVLKIDFSKYFYSIHHSVLKNNLLKTIPNPFVLELLYKLIDSYKTKEQFDYLFKNSPQYINTKEKGMPIGSLVSQIFANIYLDALDHYIKDYLMRKYYVRYVDDILIFFNTKKEADIIQQKIEDYINKHLHLVVNPKKIQLIKINKNYYTFLGHRISKYKILPSKNNQHNARQRKSILHYSDIHHNSHIITGMIR